MTTTAVAISEEASESEGYRGKEAQQQERPQQAIQGTYSDSEGILGAHIAKNIRR